MADLATANFPTAIVPRRSSSCAERFDALARAFGDPLATMFMLMRNARDQGPLGAEEARLCAAELLPYRYPKLRAQETTHRAGEGGNVSIQINIGAPPANEPPTIDVTPTPTAAPEVDPLS